MTEKIDLTMKSWTMSKASPETKLTVDGTFSAWDMGPPTIVFASQSGGPAMTIHPDGRITLGDDAKPTEAAAECVNAMSHMIQNLIDNAAQTERDRVVAWLRQEWNEDDDWGDWFAERIAAGEHLK
jgi:hypothetical protein